MKKMKDSRTSSIVLHNLLIAVLAFYLAGSDHLAGMHFLQRLFRNEYQYIFPEGMEHH